MVRLKCVFMLLVVLLTAAFYSTRVATGPGEEYVCPPCGCANDGKVSHKPGVCDVCGMKLVLKGGAANLPPDAQPAAPRQKVAILIFDGVQIIDYTGPYEVFGQAGFEVFTVAATPGTIRTAMGMQVTPHYTLENSPRPDVIVVPGGDVQRAQSDQRTIKWLQERAPEAQHVLSVCNGAYILAHTGLLDGLAATTFYDLIDGLKVAAPKTRVVRDQRYVDNGKIITTAGISSGIDGSLYVVAKLRGKAAAQMVALNMEYNYRPGSDYARGNFADRYLRAIFTRRLRFATPDGVSLQVLSTEGDAEKWEVNWQVDGRITEAELLKLIGERLAGDGKWKPLAAAKNPSRWQFSGEAGDVWQGEVTVRPLTADKGRQQVTIRINRAAGNKAASLKTQ
ncbi:MAG TPA: DJ-1/PfpI family protein [Blastocatellia bacterium]|nr:DJ-1/PfpI family protein [Blastocatellia bacterium]